MYKILYFVILVFTASFASASETLDAINKNAKYFTEYPIQFKLDTLVDDLSKGLYLKSDKEQESLFSLLSKKDLRIIRNTIFAKYGHKFESRDLTDYFRKFDWYMPATKTYQINENEKQIVSSIKEIEASLSIKKSNILKKFSHQYLPYYLSENIESNTALLTRQELRKLLNIDRDVIANDNIAIFQVELSERYLGLAIESQARGVDCASRSMFILDKQLEVRSSIDLGGYCGDIASGQYSHVIIGPSLIHVVTVHYDSEGDENSEFDTKLNSYHIKQDGSASLARNHLIR